MRARGLRRWFAGMRADRCRDGSNQTPTAILPTRHIFAVWMVAMCAISCAGTHGGPIDALGTFERPDGVRVEVRARIQAEHRRDGPRYVRGAIAALATTTSWLGLPSRQSITVLDPPWHGAPIAEPSAYLLERTPWWSSGTSMTPELAAARAVASARWAEAVDISRLPTWFVQGLIEYTARRAVVPVFQGQNLQPGYAMLELRYFGALIPRFVRIRLMPETDGDPVSAYRARPGVSPSTPSTANDEKSLAGKTVLTLSTVEHWLGTPVFDGVLAAFARASHTQPPTLESFAGVASASSGQDLSWLLHQAFGGAATFDYAVTDFSSVSNAEGRFATRVVVSRLGDGVFSGASAPRVGPYESGRGITMAVVFADGERAIDTWDGRDERRVFEYRSASRAQSATVDPDRKLLLDINQTNNSLTMSPRGAAAATRWAARWMLWLENALLGYGALI